MTERLLERERELLACSSSIAAAGDGQGRVLIIRGPAGIGKSALLLAAADHAAGQGLRVLSGRGTELEGALAFGVARQLFQPLLQQLPPKDRRRLLSGAAGLARLALGGGEVTAAGPDPFAAVHGLYWLAVNASTAGPLMVCVDDVHWADASTLAWLSYLARRVDELPLIMGLVVRQGELGESAAVVHMIESEASTVRIDVRPLSARAVAQMVQTDLSGVSGEDVAARCHEVTRGYPFLLIELLRAVREEQQSAGGDFRLEPALVPPSVAHTALRRLERLSPDARKVARAVAVLQPHAHVRQVAEMTSLGTAAVSGAADELLMADMLAAERPLAFTHPLIRTAVYEGLSPAERSDAHKEAAQVVTREEAAPELIGTHLIHTLPGGRRETVDALRLAAAHALSRGAWRAAIGYLRRAIAEPPPPSELFDVHLQLGMAEAATQDVSCADHLRQVLALAGTPAESAAAALALSTPLLFAGDPVAAVDAIDRARHGLDPSQCELALSLDALAIGIAPHVGRADLADRVIERTGLPQSSETPAERALLAQVAWRRQQRAATAEPVIQLALRALDDGGLPRTTDPIPATLPAIVLMCGDETRRADQLLADLLHHARVTGGLLLFTWVSSLRSLLALWDGRLGDAESGAQDALGSSAEGGFPYAVPVAIAALVGALIEGDRLDEADQVVATMPPAERLGNDAIAAFALHAAGHLDLVRARPETALSYFLQAHAIVQPMECRNPGIIATRSGMALAHQALGHHDQAKRFAHEELDDARAVGTPRPIGIALRVAGLMERGDEGVSLLRQSVDTLRTSTARLELARSLVELGATLRAVKPREAQEVLAEGLELARRVASTSLARRATRELSASGARPRAWSEGGVHSLTASEARTARLAAQGTPNSRIAQELFVTLKTVEKHLSSTYAKLGIGSRRQLAAALAEKVG